MVSVFPVPCVKQDRWRLKTNSSKILNKEPFANPNGFFLNFYSLD